jgi:hypothetical protein
MTADAIGTADNVKAYTMAAEGCFPSIVLPLCEY